MTILAQATKIVARNAEIAFLGIGISKTKTMFSFAKIVVTDFR